MAGGGARRAAGRPRQRGKSWRHRHGGRAPSAPQAHHRPSRRGLRQEGRRRLCPSAAARDAGQISQRRGQGLGRARHLERGLSLSATSTAICARSPMHSGRGAISGHRSHAHALHLSPMRDAVHRGAAVPVRRPTRNSSWARRCATGSAGRARGRMHEAFPQSLVDRRRVGRRPHRQRRTRQHLQLRRVPAAGDGRSPHRPRRLRRCDAGDQLDQRRLGPVPRLGSSTATERAARCSLAASSSRWGRRRFSFLTASIAVIYLLFAGKVLTSVPLSPTTFSYVITKWFDRRRGLALGIAMAGVGLGTALDPAARRLAHQQLWLARGLCRSRRDGLRRRRTAGAFRHPRAERGRARRADRPRARAAPRA